MKVGGQILWNVTPICETSQIYYLMGRRPMKDVLGKHLMDRTLHLVHWLSITQKLRRTSQESINLGRKSYLDCPSDMQCTRSGIWKGDVGCRPWRAGDDGRIGNLFKKTRCNGSIFPKKMENSFFQSQTDESNFLEEIRTWELPPWYSIDQFKEKVVLIFLENQKGFFHHLMTRFPMQVKR